MIPGAGYVRVPAWRDAKLSQNSPSTCDNLPQRKSLFVALGGLPETIVKNSEWLYMLEEETRQSLSIEGYFATEQELKAG